MRFVQIFYATVVLVIIGGLGPERVQYSTGSSSLLISPLEKEIVLEAQWQVERRWTELPSEKLWTVGTDDTRASFLLEPSQVKIGPKNHVFVLDRGDYSIKVFDETGTFLHSVAGTRGRAPGELMNPTDFDIDEKRRLWVADPPNGRVSVFRADGAFSHSLQLDHRPHRLAVINEGNEFYTAWLSPTKNALFGRYDSEGNLQKKMGQVVENQARKGVALGGSIATTSDGSLYYTLTRAGYLFRFDAEGNPVFEIETVDPAPIPEVIVDDRGGRRVDPSASIMSLGLQVVNGTLAISSVVEEGVRQDVRRAFDIYSTEGKYQHSIPLPTGTSRARLASGRIYTLTDTSLIAWNYSMESRLGHR